LTLEAAGLRMVLVEDPVAMAKVAKLAKRDRNQVRCRALSMKSAPAAVMRMMGSKGGTARMAKLTAAARRRLAKTAALARWRAA
jgi:hypothetical protein